MIGIVNELDVEGGANVLVISVTLASFVVPRLLSYTCNAAVLKCTRVIGTPHIAVPAIAQRVITLAIGSVPKPIWVPSSLIVRTAPSLELIRSHYLVGRIAGHNLI